MITRDFWNEVSVEPLPLLGALGDMVLARSENRLPKWKFRLTARLLLQVQARPTSKHAKLFKCQAASGEAAAAWMFSPEPKPAGWPSDFQIMGFELRVDREERWLLKPKSLNQKFTRHNADARRALHLISDHEARHKARAEMHRADHDGWQRLKQDVLAAIESFPTDLKPELMLSPHCLCCGKGLTDPASMARWIGPECAGTSSANVPRLFSLRAAS